MATSEPLVPTGLPYGERQKQVEARSAAGLALAPTQDAAAQPSPATGVGQAAPGASVRSARPDFDALLEVAPPPVIDNPMMAPQPPSLVEMIDQAGARTNSTLMKAVAIRMRARLIR